MEQRSSWDPNRSSASQDILRISWNQKVQYRIYMSPLPVPVLSQFDPTYALYPTPRRSILILSSHVRRGLPGGLLPSGFLTKTLYAPLHSPIRARCLLISFLFIGLPEWNLVRSTDHKAPRYVVFSTPVTSSLLGQNILLSTLLSLTPSAYIPPSMWATKFHTHTKQQARLQFCVS